MPISFPQTVATPNLSVPIVDFSNLANLGQRFEQGQLNNQQQQLNAAKIQEAQQQVALSKAFPNGLPTDPNTGLPDYAQIASTFAKFGDTRDALTTLQQQPAPLSPMFGGARAGSTAPPPASSGNPAPAPAPAARGNVPQDFSVAPSGETVSALAASVGAPSVVAQNVARAVGVAPGAPLSDAQKTRVAGLLRNYATRQSSQGLDRLQGAIFGQESGYGANTQTSVTGARGGMQIQPGTFKQYASAGEDIDNPADNRAVGNRILSDYWKRYGGDPARAAVAYFSGPGNVAPAGSPTPWKKDKSDPTGKTVSSYVNDVLRKMGVHQLRETMEPANPRVAQGFSTLPPSANAGTPSASADASDGGPAQGNPPSAAPAPVAAAPGVQPLTPAAPAAASTPPAAAPANVPSPPTAQPGAQQPLVPQEPLPQGYTDPMKAIEDLRLSAMRMSADRRPGAAQQAQQMSAWADRIEKSIQPMKMGQYDTYVDPRSRQVIAQGPGAAALQASETAGASPRLDADAERYRQTGQLPPNMGRGIQGKAEADAIRSRATDMEIAAGGNTADWPSRWQDFRAKGIGKNAAERVRANREENLNIILKATEAAIPAALEASKELPRSSFVPLNRLIQHGQIMSSDPRLVKFGMANLQLAEHWARAMNPTGVMRETDRDKALGFLSTAYGNNAYAAAVRQLETQIKREKSAVRDGKSTVAEGMAPVPGMSTKASKPDADGWMTMPNGVRVREVK